MKSIFVKLILSLIAVGYLTFTPICSYAQTAPATAAGSAEDEELDANKPGTTEINLKNADISAIIRIFSKKTGRNYILDENVKGKVTIYLPGKVSANEAIRILDSILALKGFTSVPIGENLWKIVASKEAKQSTIPTLTDERLEQATAAMVTRILPLKYIGADEVKQLVTPLISPDGLVNAYTGTNSLIIIDGEDNIKRVTSIISSIDVPSSDRDMTIIPVVNADATDIAQKLNEILGQSANTKESNPADAFDLLRSRIQETSNIANGSPGKLPGTSAVSAPLGGSKTVTARAREPKITADERTNSIIVVADDDTTARIRALVAQLDSKIDRSGNKFYVYRCQHASADELSKVLSGLTGSEGGSSTGGSSQTKDFFGSNDILGGSKSKGTSGRSNNSARTQSRLSGQTRSPGHSRSEGKSGGTVTAANLGDNISITADPATNSLIIFANKADYEKVRELLEKLDIKRRQVLVEAMLLEVALDGSNKSGVSFLGSTGGADGGAVIKNDFNSSLTQILSDPSKIQDFSIAAASAGTLSLPGGIKIPSQSVLLNAAQSNSNINILSSPTILTTDNEEAEIVVGQNIPFVSSTSTSETNLNNTFNQVERQDVGITLRLTPQISSGEFVTLKIFTEVSDIVPGTQGSTLGPSTQVRTSDTTVITKDNQMVILGGLISDSTTDSDSGIPYLKDIPVLGHIFKFSSDTHRRGNLLIFITPRIIKDQYDHRDLTIEARSKVEDAMAQFGTNSRHEEYLHNGSIDNVGEANVWEGQKPSTILPPLDKPDTEGASNEKASANFGVTKDSVIELNASPKLPTVAEQTSKTTAKVAPKPKILESSTNTDNTSSALNTAGSVYVVLGAENSASLKNLPFASGKHSNTVGLIIPNDSATNAKAFFRSGGMYDYGDKESKVEFKVLAVYDSSAQAEKEHPNLTKHWYTLAPYEVMNLGAGPWWITVANG